MSSSPSNFPVNTATGQRLFAPWWRLVDAVGISRLAWGACALSVVVLGSIALLVHQADRKEVNNALDASVSLDAKGYAKFVMLNLAIVDRQLTALREQHVQGGRLPTQATINSRLKELNGMMLQVAVANAEGLVTDSSLGTPNPPVSIADRVHFRAAKNNPADDLFISEPVLGRVSKKPSLQLVRPILAPDGKFLGVIVASIDPELLKTYFTDLKALENNGRLSIVGLDGITRFRLTNQGFTAGSDLKAQPEWQQISTSPAGIYEDLSPIDNIARRVGFRQVEGFPLAVTVGTGLEEQLQPFYRRWTLIWSLALALMAVMIAVTATIARLAQEQKRSVKLMDENRLRALENDRTKSSFLASVSHELRTPLNSILGFSELIRDTCSEPRNSQFAGLIHKSGTHLHSLVNTLLDLAKIESGKMGLALEPVDIPRLLDTLVAIHKVTADQKMIELSLSLDGVLKSAVETDRTKLVQVLNNVIHNAIKFTPSGAIFVVVKAAGQSGALISVTDTGVGIAAGDIGQVFERFNATSASINSLGNKGTGLGLALCRELLTLMSGTIDLDSEVGQGTTVNIFVPYTIAKKGEPA